jgi:hypothetical protein
MRQIVSLTLIFLLFSFRFRDEPGCAAERLFQKANYPVGVSLNTEKLKY